MSQYYDPEKIELMGRSMPKDEIEDFLPFNRSWVPVALLSNGFEMIAINMSRPEYRHEIDALLSSQKYIFVDYYLIPAKFSQLFVGRVVMKSPVLP